MMSIWSWRFNSQCELEISKERFVLNFALKFNQFFQFTQISLTESLFDSQIGLENFFYLFYGLLDLFDFDLDQTNVNVFERHW
jgi:hypothetical protein